MSTDTPSSTPNYPPPPQNYPPQQQPNYPPPPPQNYPPQNQPPQQQPQNYPPQQQQPGYPPPPQQLAPEPKKRSVVGRILTTIVGLVVAGLVVYGISYFTSDAAQSKAGECASLTGTTTKPDFKTVDCGSADANYTIAKVLGSTSDSCGGTYDEYTETASRGPDTKLCLIPKMTEGACYDLDSSGTSMGFPKVDCGKSGALKLVKEIKGVEDETQCPDGAGLTFPEPKLTLCFAPAENA